MRRLRIFLIIAVIIVVVALVVVFVLPQLNPQPAPAAQPADNTSQQPAEPQSTPLPTATPILSGVSGRELQANWRNLGTGTAFDVKFRVDGGTTEWSYLNTLSAGNGEQNYRSIHLPVADQPATVFVRYASQTGDVIEDRFQFDPSVKRLILVARTLVETPAFDVG